MYSITVIAIAAAVAAGIAAAIVLLYLPVAQTVGIENNNNNNNNNSSNSVITITTTATNATTGSNSDNSSSTTLPTGAHYRQVNVTIGGVKLAADIADTDEKRTKGLSVKDDLKEDEAMLFVFEKPGRYSFWMHGMKFPIDIIWLDSNMTVVHIEHSLEPCTPLSCPTYMPDVDSLYVLETVAGFAEKHKIIEGIAKAEFQLNQN